MVELVGLPAAPTGSVSDDDLLLIYDMTAARSYKVTRSVLFQGVARQDQPASFTDLSAEEGTFTELTAALLSFASGGGVADMVTARPSITIPAVASGGTQSISVPVAGAVDGMAVICTLTAALPAGLCMNAFSGSGVVTLSFTNASGSGSSATSREARIMLFALPA